MSIGLTLENYANSSPGATILGGPLDGANIADLQKAMATGQTGRDFTGNYDPQNSYGPLKIEALDLTLKVLQYTEKDIKLWATIPKIPATNTVQEYNQLLQYGLFESGFVGEGEIPSISNDSQYVRQYAQIKYISELRKVTHQATLVNTMLTSGVMQQEIHNGTLQLLRNVDSKLLSGDAQVIPNEWDGIFTLHRRYSPIQNLEQYHRQNPLVIDMRGANLNEPTMSDAIDILANSYSNPDTLFAPTQVLTNFTKNFLNAKVILPGTQALTGATMGQKVDSYTSQLGEIKLEFDKFMRGRPPVTATFTIQAAASGIDGLATTVPGPTVLDGAPGVPIINVAITPVAQPNDSIAGSWNIAAPFRAGYLVRAINSRGESQGTGFTVPVAGSATKSITFPVAPGLGRTEGYVVYRTADSDAALTAAAIGATVTTTLYPILYVPAPTVAVSGYNPPVNGVLAAGLIRDSNFKIPNTYDAFVFENSDQIWGFYQLLPIFKRDLAMTAMFQPFVINLYGAPALFAPSKLLRFINVT